VSGYGASAAAQPAWTPRPSADGAGRGDALMSIGEVLTLLRADFPDTTISKLRFLETEGLVEPRRTAAGYRKYSRVDVARLRYVLTAQRDHYLPLRVIRDQLAALEQADAPAQTSSETGEVRLRPALMAVADLVAEPADRVGSLRLSRAELVERSGLSGETLRALEQYGLIVETGGGWFDADALEVATAAARLADYGLEARHLRAYRAAADREIGLFTQLVAPLTHQSGSASRARAAETVRELAGYTEKLHAALVRGGLRQVLGR
jgi:DNA-binding transcriptional MerR regulator